MNTITREEKLALQHWSDELSKAAQMIRKLASPSMGIGTEIESIMGDVRFINRAIVLAAAKDMSEMPDIPKLEPISREPRKLNPDIWENFEEDAPLNIHSARLA